MYKLLILLVCSLWLAFAWEGIMVYSPIYGANIYDPNYGIGL